MINNNSVFDQVADCCISVLVPFYLACMIPLSLRFHILISLRMASVDTQSLRPRKEGLAERAVYHINNILEVPAKQVAGTSGVDRWIRLIAFILRVLKAHGLVTCALQTKKIDSVLSKLSATRYMTRRTRKWFYLLELLLLLREGLNWKERKRQFVDFCFKLFIIGSDLNDICHYLHYVKLLQDSDRQLRLRTLNADLYFFQCCVWLALYTYDYSQEQQENKRKQKLLYAIKYVLDLIVSHNDFSRCVYQLDTKVTSILGLMSSVLSLYIVWK